jgi:hypothetical protein
LLPFPDLNASAAEIFYQLVKFCRIGGAAATIAQASLMQMGNSSIASAPKRSNRGNCGGLAHNLAMSPQQAIIIH